MVSKFVSTKKDEPKITTACCVHPKQIKVIRESVTASG